MAIFSDSYPNLAREFQSIGVPADAEIGDIFTPEIEQAIIKKEIELAKKYHIKLGTPRPEVYSVIEKLMREAV